MLHQKAECLDGLKSLRKPGQYKILILTVFSQHNIVYHAANVYIQLLQIIVLFQRIRLLETKS